MTKVVDLIKVQTLAPKMVKQIETVTSGMPEYTRLFLAVRDGKIPPLGWVSGAAVNDDVYWAFVLVEVMVREIKTLKLMMVDKGRLKDLPPMSQLFVG